MDTTRHPLEVALERGDGRVILTDSLSYLDDRYRPGDVVLGGSFAGAPTVALALRRGVRAVVAHAAGVGKDGAGVGGLTLAERHGVPAAAISTLSARIADGRSLYDGTVSHANGPAAALGVRPGLPAREAAELLLAAPPGRPLAVADAADEGLHTVAADGRGTVVAVWSLMLVTKPSPGDVFCVASHAGRTMAAYARTVGPRGVVANDAGLCKGDSGVEGVFLLEADGIAAAAVDCMTARIGDGLSTYRDGVVSVVNGPARARGVAAGMAARDAARLLLVG